MNAQEWNKLKQNWDDLLSLYPKEMCQKLYVKNVITDRDKENIDISRLGKRDQMEKLLNILKTKSSEVKPFSNLLKVIGSDPANKWLVDQIKDTETKADVKVLSQVDPHLLDSQVRTVLLKHFTNKEGALIKLSDIREVLKETGVFNKSNDWSNDILQNFICKEFLKVEIVPKREREGRNARKTIYLKNVGKIEPVQDASSKFTLPTVTSIKNKELTSGSETCMKMEDVITESDAGLKVKEMNPSQLKAYLLPKFQEDGLAVNFLDDLEKESISGKIFLTMKEEDFKQILKSAPFGVLRFLTMQVQENKFNADPKIFPEYVRAFDSDVKHTDKYVKGNCVDAYVNARGKKTMPIKNFHLVDDKNTEKALEFIASEVVPFASACLNERRNGTIYFGISPSKDVMYNEGEIVGVSLSKDDVQCEISYCMNVSFFDCHKSIISSTVREPRFVPVIDGSSAVDTSSKWVIEVDIVPSSSVIESDTIKTKLACLSIHAKKLKSKEIAIFGFSDEGLPKVVSSRDLIHFEKDHPRIVKQRQDEEEKEKKNVTMNPDLRTKFLNLLTGGKEILEDTIYPFLVLSPIDEHMDSAYLLNNVSFIKHLESEVVFDFDPKGSTKGIYKNLDSEQNEVMRVLITSNFDKTTYKNNEEYKEFQESLASETRTSWVFCNGYEDMDIPMTPTEWNKKCSNAFEECLCFFKDNFDEERIIIIMCLFSKNYMTMIGACDEVLKKLPDSWLLLAETEDIAKAFQDQILLRSRADKDDLKFRCVIGMSWTQVDTTIRQVMKFQEIYECLLPCSTGVLIELREKKLKDWCDLDVVTAGEFNIAEEEEEKKKKEMEERFYRGEQANWLNFWFHDQILERDIHKELMDKVKQALEGKDKEEEDKVTTMLILHQPGAGGTTSAKQVLWDLRKKYRCCAVKAITDQTCDQLDEFRRYGEETSPKPVLILVDNEDDDKCLQLRGKLEEKGRRHWRNSEESFNVYCTIIFCIRRAALPKQLKDGEIALRQELIKTELEWFKHKNESLESRFRKDKDSNVNPKFLISFNILRENFNKDYVSKVVKEFSDAVKSPKEVKLLKIISLLNTYDPEFKPVPVSCLDKLLEDQSKYSVSKRFGNLTRQVRWEATLSEGVKVLLNLASGRNQPGKTRQSLRVFNKIIAHEILQRMKDRTGQKESEVMNELMESGVFEQESTNSKQLKILINNVMKKREYQPDGIRKHKFSRFVLYVKDNEGAEVATDLLERLFELNQDPFTAQLIARFYIDLKNWDRAEDFAKRATSMLPSSSFLWDTYGQVFRSQLFDKISPANEEIKPEGISPLIKLSEKCIEAFRKEQTVSEREVTNDGQNNFAGYFGELRAIILLLNALKMCPSLSKDNMLHRYLVDGQFNPHHFGFLNEQEVAYLKNLENSCKEAMRRLDEEYLQMKEDLNLVSTLAPTYNFDKRILLDLKVNLDVFFGEDTDVVPHTLNELDKCEYRRRRARKLGATSLNLLLSLRQNEKTLMQIYSLLIQNVPSQESTYDDLRSILDTVTVLLIDGYKPEGLTYEMILEWSKKLYQMARSHVNRQPLETFLYYVLYNFPTEERKQINNLCSTHELCSAIDKWRVAFHRNYPKLRDEDISLKRRETTLFFLGNGSPLEDIVHQDSLKYVMDLYSYTEKWQHPELRKYLRLMTGILSNRGDKVTHTIVTAEGNRFPLSIPTSHRVTKKDMWQKTVYFYIGFSFSGPKAFGMSLEELGTVNAQNPRIRTQIFVLTSGARTPIPTLESLLKKWRFIEKQMQADPKKKRLLEKEHNKLSKEINKLIGE